MYQTDPISLAIAYMFVIVLLSAGLGLLFKKDATVVLKWEWKTFKKFIKWILKQIVKLIQAIDRSIKI